MKNRMASLVFGSLLLLAASSQAQLTQFGYAGTADENFNHAGAIAAAGIPVNVGTVDFSDVWVNTDLAAITADFQSRGMKTGLFLDKVLWISTADSTSPCVVPINGVLVQGKQRLRGNWRDRLANFAATNGAYINSSTTSFLVIHAEVNNACARLDHVELAANEVESYFPGIPTVMGYGAGDGSRPAPAYFPSAIDRIGIFAYGYFDPENPDNVNNTNNIKGVGPDFYNPANRYDTSTIYGDLLSKLLSHQRVIYVMDAHWLTGLHGDLGWPKWYLQYVANNCYDWASKQPEVSILLPFLWPSPDADASDGRVHLGTADLPQAVRDRHAVIGAAIVP